MTIRSSEFNDVYFSVEDGLAETRHVFLSCNNLPAAWEGRGHFTIAETGFGTGLNFFAAAQLFEKTAGPGQTLHYISFEKHPLSWGEIEAALAQWRGDIGAQMEMLHPLYPLRIPGFHRVRVSPQIILTLIFDDVNDAIPQLDVPCGVDAWFLDGFAPAKNPQMWTDTLFANMARLSCADSTFATFTAAGLVKRGLATAGFDVEKRDGFGRKRDMLCGRYAGGNARTQNVKPKRVAVAGGGLAGTAAAYVLKQARIEPVIFETGPELAGGASGNDLGLYNPRLSQQRTAESNFFSGAFALAHRTFKNLKADIDFNPCGSVHLATDAEKEKRLRGALANWGWHPDHMNWGERGLFLPDAGNISPRKLCHAYATDIEVRLNTSFPAQHDFDAVILACGAAVKNFTGFEDLPIHTVRGQVTSFHATLASEKITHNICYGGYVSPARNGIHMTGATFQPWRTDMDVTDDDSRENLENLAAVLPELRDLKISGARTALRTASKDRFPVIGAADRPGIYLSTAHGSHGIISSLMAAHVICDAMTGWGNSLSLPAINRANPARFNKK